jgi:hypothetical protein
MHRMLKQVRLWQEAHMRAFVCLLHWILFIERGFLTENQRRRAGISRVLWIDGESGCMGFAESIDAFGKDDFVVAVAVEGGLGAPSAVLLDDAIGDAGVEQVGSPSSAHAVCAE